MTITIKNLLPHFIILFILSPIDIYLYFNIGETLLKNFYISICFSFVLFSTLCYTSFYREYARISKIAVGAMVVLSLYSYMVNIFKNSNLGWVELTGQVLISVFFSVAIPIFSASVVDKISAQIEENLEELGRSLKIKQQQDNIYKMHWESTKRLKDEQEADFLSKLSILEAKLAEKEERPLKKRGYRLDEKKRRQIISLAETVTEQTKIARVVGVNRHTVRKVLRECLTSTGTLQQTT